MWHVYVPLVQSLLSENVWMCWCCNPVHRLVTTSADVSENFAAFMLVYYGKEAPRWHSREVFVAWLCAINYPVVLCEF